MEIEFFLLDGRRQDFLWKRTKLISNFIGSEGYKWLLLRQALWLIFWIQRFQNLVLLLCSLGNHSVQLVDIERLFRLWLPHVDLTLWIFFFFDPSWLIWWSSILPFFFSKNCTTRKSRLKFDFFFCSIVLSLLKCFLIFLPLSFSIFKSQYR